MQRAFPTNLIDYRDRASVLIWVVLMGLAAQRFLALPERSFTAILLGSPVTLNITDSAILGALLAAAILGSLGLAFWVQPLIWMVGLGVITAGLAWHATLRRHRFP